MKDKNDRHFYKGRTILYIFCAFFLGIFTGLLFHLFGWQEGSFVVENILTPVNTVYLNALKFVAVPVVFFSILSCIANMGNLRTFGRIGVKTVGLFALTSILATSVGLLIFTFLQPADGFSMVSTAAYEPTGIEFPTLMSIFIGIVPDNLFSPFVSANMLQIIFISVLLGISLNLLKEKVENLRTLVDSLNALFLKVTSLFILLVPIVTFSAMAKLVATMGSATLLPLLKLFAAILVGMAVMMLLYAIMLMMARLNPLTFFGKWAGTLLVAFSLNCASATVPVTLHTCEKKLGVSPKVSSFSIPLGATVNMDGTCIYLSVGVLFLAQVYGIDMNFTNLLATMISVFVLSVGAPGVSGSGLVCLSLLAAQLNIPMEGIGMLMGLDKLFGMMRSATNVTSDVVNTTLVAAWEGLLNKDVFSAKKGLGFRDDTIQ